MSGGRCPDCGTRRCISCGTCTNFDCDLWGAHCRGGHVVQPFASGGIVSKPRRPLVQEPDPPEFVVPLAGRNVLIPVNMNSESSLGPDQLWWMAGRNEWQLVWRSRDNRPEPAGGEAELEGD